MRLDSRSITGLLAVSALLLLLLPGCDTAPSRNDSAPDDGGTVTCPGGDKAPGEFTSAKVLAAGEAAKHTDYICPRRDRDIYKITVPAGHKLINIDIKYVKPIPMLNLTYQIYSVGEKLVKQAPAASDKGFQTTHCINPGTYYLSIQDDADTGYDAKDPYVLYYTTEPDKDTTEPNDTVGQARAISGSATGLISCAGDKDYYKFTYTAGQLLQIKLAAAASTTVDLKYTILDSASMPITTNAIPDGTKPNAKLDVYQALPKAGTYYIVVEDGGSDDADTKTKYTLTLSKKTEPDAQDKGQRNDTVATATAVGTVTSGTVTKTYSGQLASRGDVDYFVVNGFAGAGVNKPGVMEVILSYSASSTGVGLDPSFSYLYGDAAEPCTKDACCKVAAKSTCKTNLQCLRKSYNCIKKGDALCNDASCTPSPSSICAGESACAGATVCLPGKTCAVEHALRWAKGKKTAVTVKTSQLLIHPGPWYIRVADLGSDDYEYGRNYTLKITAKWDPDGAKELDSEYFPNRCLLVEDPQLKNEEWKLHVKQAITKIAAKTITLGTWYTGYLSYEGDIDFFKFANPCPNADCTLDIHYDVKCAPTSGAPLRYCQSPKEVQNYMGLEHLFTIRRDDDEAEGWTGKDFKGGTSGVFGPGSGQCVYSYKSHGAKPYYFTVEDMGTNYWSLTCPYKFMIKKVADGCAAPCKTHPVSGNCGA